MSFLEHLAGLKLKLQFLFLQKCLYSEVPATLSSLIAQLKGSKTLEEKKKAAAAVADFLKAGASTYVCYTV